MKYEELGNKDQYLGMVTLRCTTCEKEFERQAKYVRSSIKLHPQDNIDCGCKNIRKCSFCQKSSPEVRFTKTHRVCVDCRKTYNHEYYQENKEKVNSDKVLRQTKTYRENFDRVSQYKESHSCVDCGRFFPACAMDWDHQRDKLHNISEMVKFAAWDLIEAEIAKCELICAVCHRIRTAKEGSYHRVREQKPKARSTKGFRPPKDELVKLVQTFSISAIGRQFGVSDTMVRKWCKIFDIDYKLLSKFSLQNICPEVYGPE
jgi:hypothetical protein